MTKIIKNQISFRILIVLLIFIGLLSSCRNSTSYTEKGKMEIECKMNDSLTINLLFYDKSNVISTIIIKNTKNNIQNIYSFRDDGVTPLLIGKEKDGLLNGSYFTYYSSGILNNKLNYKNGKLDGEYTSYDDSGVICYKAYYENDVEKQVVIKDTTSNIKVWNK